MVKKPLTLILYMNDVLVKIKKIFLLPHYSVNVPKSHFNMLLLCIQFQKAYFDTAVVSKNRTQCISLILTLIKGRKKNPNLKIF